MLRQQGCRKRYMGGIGRLRQNGYSCLSLANIFLFFGGSSLKRIKTQMGYWKTRRNFRKYMR